MSEMNNKQLSEMSLSELNKYKKQINHDADELRNQIKFLQENLHKHAETLKQINDEKEQREHIQEAKKMIDNDIRHIKYFELLTNNELEIIIKKMDTRDYRSNINHPRFVYLKSMCENLIDIKRQQQKYELVDIVLNKTMESNIKQLYPQRKLHSYVCKDINGNVVCFRYMCSPYHLL